MVWEYKWFQINNETELLELLKEWEYINHHPIYKQSVFLRKELKDGDKITSILDRR